MFCVATASLQRTMSRACAFEWYKRFREGRKKCEDDQRSRRPVTSRTDSNIDRVKQLVRVDYRLTVRMISEEFSIGRDTCGKSLLKTWKCASRVRKWFQRFSPNTKNNEDLLFAKILPIV